MKLLLGIFLLFLAVRPFSARAERWDDDEPELKKPSQFKRLPKPVITQLEKEKCSIAAFKDESQPNVIQGRFLDAGSKSWTALCVVDGQKRIRVISEKKSACKQEIPDGELGAIRGGIYVAGVKYIREHIDAYGTEAPVKKSDINHDGIGVTTARECCSSVYYCHQGRWLVLPGAD
jgi:hypothetical protein